MTDPTSVDPVVSSDQSTTASTGRDHLTRSEERLRISTRRVPSGTARLEKFLVTELRTITVEVTHEQVRLVYGPATADRTRPTSQMNSARWMYVNREEIVISKRVVPVERVRLEIHPVTEQRQITEQIRTERIEDTTTTAT